MDSVGASPALGRNPRRGLVNAGFVCQSDAHCFKDT